MRYSEVMKNTRSSLRDRVVSEVYFVEIEDFLFDLIFECRVNIEVPGQFLLLSHLLCLLNEVADFGLHIGVGSLDLGGD